MDYTNAMTKANADASLAISDVEDWLKSLESHGATVEDLNKRISILQAVAVKLASNAKIEANAIDVRKTYIESNPFRAGLFGC